MEWHLRHLLAKADPLVAMSWLQNVYEAYHTRGYVDDAVRAQSQSKEKGLKAKDSMKQIVSTVSVPADDLNQILADLVAEGFFKSLTKVSSMFIPRINSIKADLDKLKNEHPLQALLSISIIEDGQVVSKSGSVEDDPEGRLRLEIGQRLTMSSAYLAVAIDKIFKEFAPTEENILEHLYRSPLFESGRQELILEGIKAYLSNDYVKSVHVLVPQIEHALRCLLPLLGQPSNKSTRTRGIMQEQNINDVLANAEVRKVVPEDVRQFILVALADQCGLNIRHRLAHGLMNRDAFNRHTGDLVFSILLCLSEIQVVTENNPNSDEQGKSVESA